MNSDNLLWGLDEKKYDGILSSLQPLVFNLKSYAFSHVFLFSGPVIVAPKDSEIQGTYSLRGKKIGVVKGSSGAVLTNDSRHHHRKF